MQYSIATLAALLAAVSASPLATRATPYTFYQGDGSAAKGWPDQSKWVKDFDTMWSLNAAIIAQGCWGAGEAQNSAAETADLKSAISSVAKDSGVDARYILATVMQESNGCVRVAGTYSPGDKIYNPGLMQDHSGANTCNDIRKTPAVISNPCPANTITGMIKDGTEGTSGGDGLKQTLAQAAKTFKGSQEYYVSSRLYNAGSNPTGDLGAPGATRCYSSDIANRLMGWVGSDNKACTLK